MTDIATNAEKTSEEPISADEQVRRFRSTHSTHRYADTAPLRSALDLLKDTDEVRTTYLLYDLRLFDLMIQRGRPERFAPMMSGTQDNGMRWSYPDLANDFPDAALAYYAERVQETDNPFHRAIYADFLVCHGNPDAKDRSVFCQIAVQSYMEAAQLYLAEGEDRTAVDGLLRAMDLALKFNRKELVKASVGATVQAIEHLTATGRPRWTLELLGFLAPRSVKLAPYVDADLVPRTVTNVLKFYRENEQDSWHIEREYLGISAEFHKAHKAASDLAACRLRIAETFAEEADWKCAHYPNGYMIAAHFYDEAIQAFSGIKDTEKRVEALKLRMLECNREAKKHYTTFSHEITFQPDEVERLQQHVDWYGNLSVAQALAHASVNPNILPTWERAEEIANQALKDSIMHQFFSTQVMDGDLKVKTVSEDEERQKYQIITSFLSNLHFSFQLLLSPIMSKIATVHGEAVPIGVEELLRDSGFIGETHIRLIVHGVRAYLAGDDISALHVLVFQVEGVLRDLLAATGRATFSQEAQGEYRHYTLTTVLNVLGQVNGFDTDLSALIRYFLADMMGDNLRNVVGHSLADLSRFTRENTEIVLMILVRLSLLRVQSRATSEGEDITNAAGPRTSST